MGVLLAVLVHAARVQILLRFRATVLDNFFSQLKKVGICFVCVWRHRGFPFGLFDRRLRHYRCPFRGSAFPGDLWVHSGFVRLFTLIESLGNFRYYSLRFDGVSSRNLLGTKYTNFCVKSQKRFHVGLATEED